MAKQTYRSSITRKALGLSLIPLSVGVGLIVSGGLAFPKFSPTDSSRILFAFGPVVFGSILLAILLWGFLQNLGQEVTLKGGSFSFARGSKGFTCRWDDLVVGRLRPGPVRVLLLSDGKRFANLLDIFFPDFDEMHQQIEARAKRASDRERTRITT